MAHIDIYTAHERRERARKSPVITRFYQLIAGLMESGKTKQ